MGGALQIGINQMPARTDNPEFWRFRAEEARTIAAVDAEAKGIMLRIADDYERIVKLIEEFARKRQ
jgi:hypothetical protein